MSALFRESFPQLSLLPVPAIRLGLVSRIFSGATPDKSNLQYWTDGTFPWIASGEVNQKIITRPTEFITYDAVLGSSTKLMPRGSLVIALAGQGKTKAKVAQMDIDAYSNQSLACIAEFAGESRYLYWWLTSLYREIRGLSSQETRDGLNQAIIGQLPVPLFSLPVQKSIADFLDRETTRIDQLIEKKERLANALESKRKVVAIHCLSHGMSGFHWDAGNFAIRFALNKPEWCERSVKSVVCFMTSGSRGWSDLLGEEGEGFLQSGNIGRRMEVDLNFSQRVQPQTGAEAERTHVRPGDVLVCITGGRTGAVGIVRELNERAYINQHICLLRANRGVIMPELLAHLLWSEIGQKQIELCQYGVKQGLGFSEVANIRIPVPPLEYQSHVLTEISRETGVIDSLSDLIHESLVRLYEYRFALITAAVTGQIDVATWGKTGETDRRLEAIEQTLGAELEEAAL